MNVTQNYGLRLRFEPKNEVWNSVFRSCSEAKKDPYQNGYQSHSVMRIAYHASNRTFTTLFIKHLR